jgi:uncharacterized protein GlcG (DUF336 family)
MRGDARTDAGWGRLWTTWSAASVLVLLTACAGDRGLGEGGCAGQCATASDFLDSAEVEKVLRQGALEAQARGARATIAVVDRVGNVLGVFQMAGASPGFQLQSGRPVQGGLERARLPSGEFPSSLAAVAKALTGAFLSSEGNAFSTRTASQIIQENFNPRELSQPSGPLYGVQYSQLPCSDVVSNTAMLGPRPSPLGLSGDPGGLPLYKNGRLVGGVGVISDSVYSIDLDIENIDTDEDELISVGAASSFMAPLDRRADRITADGRTFRFTDGEALRANPAGATTALRDIPGMVVPVAGFFDGAVRRGVAFGTPDSGFRSDTGAFAELRAHVIVDGQNRNRYEPRAGSDGLLRVEEVISIVKNGLRVANRTRAQIRRPLGSAAEVTLAVVDTRGVLLAVARTPDAPVFGADVAAQKARTAAFFSSVGAAADLLSVPATEYSGSGQRSSPGNYLLAARAFLNDPQAFSNGIAHTGRSIGNLHRPLFPDGVSNTEQGPLSTPYSNWSPFHVGLQSDLVNSALLGRGLGVGCAFLPQIFNGIQIFPGSVPIYRGAQLVGAVGVSGDGVDQDDMIAYLGLANAGRELNSGIGNAPRERRADLLEPRGLGSRLRYVQCPQAPFNDSTEQNVCSAF